MQDFMRGFCEKDCDISSNNTMDPSACCISTESQIQNSSLSENLTLKMGNQSLCDHNMKESSFKFQERDSSSTQSTGQSYYEVGSVGESKSYKPNIIFPGPECSGTQIKDDLGQLKPNQLIRQEYIMPSQFNLGHPYACVPLPCTDPYYNGLFAVCTPKDMNQHSQIVGDGQARVALPLELPQNDPIYVNAKQYHAILRRRQYRAKLEAQNKLSKTRKPYLHESRHLHALKRARGSGGKFINTKSLQDSKPTGKIKGNSPATQVQVLEDMSKSEIYHSKLLENCLSSTSSSDITTASDSDNIFQHQEFRFSLYPSSVSSVYSDSQQYLAVHQ